MGHNKEKRTAGFTLIEMLVVTAIVRILASITVPMILSRKAAPQAGAALVGIPANRIDSQELAVGKLGADGMQWVPIH